MIYDRVIASKIRRVDSDLCHTGRACRVQMTPLDISLGLQQGCSIISGTQSIPIKKGDAEQRNSNATIWNGYGTANPKWLPFRMQSIKWALFHRSDTSKPCWKTYSLPIWSKVWWWKHVNHINPQEQEQYVGNKIWFIVQFLCFQLWGRYLEPSSPEKLPWSSRICFPFPEPFVEPASILLFGEKDARFRSHHIDWNDS